MREVESKAHISQEKKEKIMEFLSQNAVFLGEEEKNDIYFSRKLENKVAFRLRTIGQKYFVTQKEREYSKNMVELNKEREFEIKDKNAFLEFVFQLGFEVLYEKQKFVRKYQYNEMLVEVVHFDTIGDFLEAEIIAEESQIEWAEHRIFSFFKNMELDKDIEPIPYFMLLDSH